MGNPVHQRIAPLVILSILLLAVCCQALPSAHVHTAMESEMGHVVILAMNIPGVVTPSFALLLLWCVMTLAIFATQGTTAGYVSHGRISVVPESGPAPGLRCAFADGILNPKPY